MKKISNKILAFGLAILTGILVSGCGANDSSAGQPAGSEQKTSGTQEEKQDPQAAEAVEPAATASNDAECVAAIERLMETEPVDPAEKKVLEEMAQCVTLAKIPDEQGGMFRAMSEDKRACLQYEFFEKIKFGQEDSVFANALPMTEGSGEYEYYYLVNKEEALDFFHDVYGEESIGPIGFEEGDDENLLISFGAGDPWEIIEQYQLFEDENYFLLRGPAYYEDNSGTTDFKGYAEILFVKDKGSRYGVTLLYGRYNNDGNTP